MKELFLNVLTASMHGSVIIGVILLLRPVLKKAPKNILCLLWLLAALRLLLPFEIRSSLSLQPDLEGINLPGSEYAEQMTSGFQSSTQDVILPPVEWEDVPVQTPDTEITRQPVEDTVIYEVDVPLKVKILENYEQIVALLWMAGAAGLMIYSAVAYLLLKRKVRDSVVYADGVWVCGSLESAFVLGFFRPQIYLSAGLPENAREYVLVHERTHIRRGDHWWKLLGYLTLALHWFNPLVWLAYSLLCRDLEMACDEAVVKTMSVAERKTYSAALLACSVRGARIAACPVAFGEVSVKQRIKNVLHYRKPAFWITIVALVLVAVIAVCFLTSPENAPDLSFLNYENAISTVADQDQVMTIYCDEDSIIPCQVDGSALAKYLDNANWKQRRWEPGDQSSPGSIEFIISDDYRITVFDRNFARVKYNGDTRYYRISRSDYEQALELIDVAKYAELTWNLEVNASNVTPTGLTFTFIQHGPFAEGDRASLMYGSEYTLQVRNGQKWEEVPMVPHEYEVAWTMEAYLIEQGKTTHQKIDWQWIYGTLSAGEYRIGKTVSLERAPGDSETHTFWAEFTIPEQSQEELIQRCRDALVTLQNAQTGYQYIVNMDNPNEVINTYLYDGQNWCFKYRRPGWDYQEVIMLAYEGKLYTFEGDPIDEGVKAPIHHWKLDESGDIEPFLLYPFDLNWEKILLNYRSSETNEEGQIITLEFPEYFDLFTFCFEDDGDLLWFEIDDSSGEPEATTTRIYVQYPGESITESLSTLYSAAVNTVNENELVYKDSFYQSMFLPESSSLNAAELFYGFYQNSKRFTERLAAAEAANPNVAAKVIECMGREVNNYAPNLFRYMVNQLSDTDYPDILNGLKSIFEESEKETQTGDDSNSNYPLEKCQSALKKQQAKDYFQIMDNCFFSAGEGGNHSGSTLWYIYKNSVLGQSQSEDPSGMNEWWNLYCDGSYYHRIAHASEGPQFGISWESDWNNGQFQAFPLPTSLWPLEFDFASADATLVEVYADEYGESITFSVFGDPLLQGGAPQNYIVTFHLNTHNVLQRVQMQYLYGDAQVERILVFRTTTREEVMEMIDQCHAEALLHIRGICTDPNCTEKAHDHSGVKCTDDHCDNPTHHHSSHH